MSIFSLRRALSEAVAFIPKAWLSCWLSLLLLLGVIVIAVNAKFTDYGITMWLISFVTIVLMVFGGLYRAALFGKNAHKFGLGFGGVQLGRAEMRLITGGLFSALFLLFFAFFAVMIVILVASNTELSNHYNNSFKTVLAAFFEPFTVEKIVIIVFSAIFGVLLLSLLVGLLLYQAASIAQDRTISINALSFSQGKLLKIMIGIGLLVLPVVLVAGLLKADMVHFNQNTLLLLKYVLLSASVSIVLPMLIGFLVSIYRQAPTVSMTEV